MASKKLIPGVDYEAFDWTDYIGGAYSYVTRFEKLEAFNIIWAGVSNRMRKIVSGAKIAVDDLRNGDKSFYGKARIAHIESKSGRIYEILISYNTAVAMIDSAGRFIRLWNGYSATTAKHIARFMNRYGLHGVNKAEWLHMPIGKPSGIAVD